MQIDEKKYFICLQQLRIIYFDILQQKHIGNTIECQSPTIKFTSFVNILCFP